MYNLKLYLTYLPRKTKERSITHTTISSAKVRTSTQYELLKQSKSGILPNGGWEKQIHLTLRIAILFKMRVESCGVESSTGFVVHCHGSQVRNLVGTTVAGVIQETENHREGLVGGRGGLYAVS